MLTDFFRINLPYGIAKNEKNEWMAFNREYMPLGYNSESTKAIPGKSYLDLPIYTKYKRISDKLLEEIAGNENALQRNESGEITMVILYNDGTNPKNKSKQSNVHWDNYFEKLRKISNLNRS